MQCQQACICATDGPYHLLSQKHADNGDLCGLRDDVTWNGCSVTDFRRWPAC